MPRPIDLPVRAQGLLRRFQTDDVYFIQTFFNIVDEAGKLVPFRIANRPMQQDFVNRVVVPKVPKVVELKARRVGGTSLFMALGLARAIRRRNYGVLLLAQSDSDTTAFMKGGFRRLYMDMAEQVELPDGSVFRAKPELVVDTEHLLEFGNGSRIVAGTAGSIKVGRGQGFDMIVGTEVARWDVGRPPGTAEECWAMAIGAQADRPNTFTVQESTPYGAAGFFYETYKRAKSGDNGYLPLFYDWRWRPEYAYGEGDLRALEGDRGEVVLTDAEQKLTAPQARWRRAMIAELGGLGMFLQEYPEDDETCFRVSGDPYFDVDLIDRCIQEARPTLTTSHGGRLRIWQSPRPGVKYIVAVDPGGAGVERRFQSQERDFDAVGVFDQHLQHVATLHGRWDTRTLGQMVVDLCKYYGDAHLIVESGPWGESLLLVIATYLGYKNLYYERDAKGAVVRVGLRIGGNNRPTLAENLKDTFEHGVFRTDDRELLGEMRAYQRSPTMGGRIRLEARAGHDDLVDMAQLGAWAWAEGRFGRSQATRVHIPGRPIRKVLPQPVDVEYERKMVESLEARSG